MDFFSVPQEKPKTTRRKDSSREGINTLVYHLDNPGYYHVNPIITIQSQTVYFLFLTKIFVCDKNLDKKLHKISIINSFNFLQSRSLLCLSKLNFAVKLCFVGISICFNGSQINWVNIYQLIEHIPDLSFVHEKIKHRMVKCFCRDIKISFNGEQK